MKQEARDIFVRNLNDIMNKRKIKQKPLSELMGIPLSTMSSWVNGQSYPRVDKMQLLADTLRVSMRDLTDDITESVIYSTINLPFLGYGSCGSGTINEDEIEWRDLPEWLLGNKRNYDNYFLACAKGKSMERAGIKDGSLLIFFRQPTLNDGEIGVFGLNGEEYVKRYSRQGNIIILNSEALNDGYDPIIVTEDDDFRIIAKLYKCIIDFE
ncbi:LexA family transcriptional regulator [Erysipelothrix aquatica]|uniref:LexA family transcriptional regulator n=1 Tax=Erysipelothrix aquatica TaxID=2683714 RepID=UPI00135C4972|nr:XRE family transcriptional regulator [Erysipelothrix aquatica]